MLPPQSTETDASRQLSSLAYNRERNLIRFIVKQKRKEREQEMYAGTLSQAQARSAVSVTRIGDRLSVSRADLRTLVELEGAG